MSMHIVGDEQRRDRPQSPCAQRVSSAAGHLQRWRSWTMCTDIACVAPPCICPAALETRPLQILGQAPRSMTRKGGFKNIKLGKNVYRQMKRRGPPDNSRIRQQPKPPLKKSE